ncbi:aspartic peptidase domain-containing protein [Biscogniauxia mediterranea]|nr:aspartic peptidase domain-containing protein [Biscogniauxia mediterranea]
MLLVTLLSFLAIVCLASPLAPRVYPATHGEVIHSLSLPGVQFRRASPMTTVPVEKKVQNHFKITQVPHQDSVKRHRSVTSLFAQVQRDNGGFGYENITVVNAYAAEYAVELLLNGHSANVIIDSASADTWVKGANFTCLNTSNHTQGEDPCWFGPPYHGNFSGKPIPDQHFAIKYGDGETIQGYLGYMDVQLANITVLGQEVAIASQGTWHGNNVTSGVLGLAYPSLTSAFLGNDFDDTSQFNSVQYSPLFTSMISDGLIEPYWTIAMDRNSSTGLVGIGGMPPVDVTASHEASTPILIADLIQKDITAYEPSFYTIVPDGIKYGSSSMVSQYPFILDSGTTLIYLPPDLAEAVNAQFQPPATYLWYYGAYFTDCDAIPPFFAVTIERSDFIVNPKDLLNRHVRDPATGLCQTGIASGGSGPYVLGVAFLTNVVMSVNIGTGYIEFFSREFY